MCLWSRRIRMNWLGTCIFYSYEKSLLNILLVIWGIVGGGTEIWQWVRCTPQSNYRSIKASSYFKGPFNNYVEWVGRWSFRCLRGMDRCIKNGSKKSSFDCKGLVGSQKTQKYVNVVVEWTRREINIYNCRKVPIICSLQLSWKNANDIPESFRIK